MWPIRDTSGDTIGFGARRLFDDDRIEAKYLNTTETAIYKKSTVLYGIDLAKKAISSRTPGGRRRGLHRRHGGPPLRGRGRGRHLRHGLRRRPHQAAAPPHARRAWARNPARIIFTFDGDAAGQKAAMKAFEEDQRWAASPMSPSRRRDGPVRSAPAQGTGGGPRISSRMPCRCSSSPSAPDSPAST
jgi:DNA primase